MPRWLFIPIALYIGLAMLGGLVSLMKVITPIQQSDLAISVPRMNQVVKVAPKKPKHVEPSVIGQMKKTLSTGWGELPGQELNLRACLVYAMMFSDAAENVAAARKLDLTSTELSVFKKYKRSAVAWQIKSFPGLRRKFTKFYADALWENDVTAKASGEGNRTINFVGGLFAANANKKSFMEIAYGNLRAMRFVEARFRWYERADEFTFWHLNAPKDGDLAIIKDDSFVIVQ